MENVEKDSGSILNAWKESLVNEAPIAGTENAEQEDNSGYQDADEQLAAITDMEDSLEATPPPVEPLMSNSTDDLLNRLDTAKEPASSADIEFIMAKDETGRKQKIEVNYSDKEAIKKAYAAAAGMRKFQAERDVERKAKAELEKKHTELNDVYSKLNDAFQKGGAKAVVALLGSGEQAWHEAVNTELKHRDYLDSLTPDEKYKLEIQEVKRVGQEQLKAEQTRREAFERQIAEREEQTALRSLESKLNPAFDRYRFAGKLGDEQAESTIDEAIWTKVTNRLSELPDDVELTQGLIDKEFRAVADTYRKVINKQAETKVQKTIETKKVNATERAQVAATKGLKQSTGSKQFVDSIKSGDLASAWAALSSGKVKL